MPIFGCGLALSGSFKTTGRGVRLRDAFMAQGWTEMPAYSADGTDGTSFAFRRGAVSCLVRGTWDGGAADDPSCRFLQGRDVLRESYIPRNQIDAGPL